MLERSWSLTTTETWHCLCEKEIGKLLANWYATTSIQFSVFKVCYRLTGETREAEDLAQEAFGRAFQRFHHYNPMRPFSPWMRRVAANYCRNHLGVQRLTTSPLGDERHAPKSQNEASPESLRLEGERYEMFRAAIISLLPHDQLVIELSN